MHLANKEFVICELTNPEESMNGKTPVFKTHWDKIFI